MAAIEIRADIATHHDYYLVPLPHTGETQTEFVHWVDDAVNGVQPLQSFYEVVNERTREPVLVGEGYEFTRTRQHWDGQQMQRWQERVQIIRSVALAKRQQQTLEERLRRADKAIRALTPPVGPGRRQIQEEENLRQGVEEILREQKVEGLLQVSWERQEKREERYEGRGRGGRTVRSVWRRRYGIK
jgi:transposase